MAIRNETGAHLALQETARTVNAPRIGAHFHKPAPRRARRVNPGPVLGVCVAFIFPTAAAIVAAAFLVL